MVDQPDLASRGIMASTPSAGATMPDRFSFLGRGIYSAHDAARLTGLDPDRVLRWARGYSFKRHGRVRRYPPLLGAVDGETRTHSLSFHDLIEVLYLEHFSSIGVSVNRLRQYETAARAALGVSHPFATNRFKSDGKRILLDVDTKDGELLDLISEQFESKRLLKRMLRGKFDLNADRIAERWWPLTRRYDVVIDPDRRFGAPISNMSGIPTAVLAAAYKAEGTYQKAAWWFEVPDRAVRHAVTFERRFPVAA